MINDKFICLNRYGEVSMYFTRLNMLQNGHVFAKMGETCPLKVTFLRNLDNLVKVMSLNMIGHLGRLFFKS